MSKTLAKIASEGRKRAPLVTCNQCKGTVDPQNTVLCSVCKNNYEFDCIGYSERLHRLKDSTTKKNWRCKQCEKKVKTSASATTTSTNASTSTVTTRRKRLLTKQDESPQLPKIGLRQESAPTNISPQESPSPISQAENSHDLTVSHDSDKSPNTSGKKLSRSMDYTVTDSTQFQEMKDTITLLQSEYAILQNEFDNTSLENNNLRQQIAKLTRERDTLKALCQSPINETQTNQSSRKKRSKRMKRQASTEVFSPSQSSEHPPETTGQDNEFMEPQLQTQNIDECTEGEATSSLQKSKHKIRLFQPVHEQSDGKLETSETEILETPKHNTIYILGGYQCQGLASNLLKSRQNTQYETYKISSFIKPDATSEEILHSSETRMASSNDIIIISIGEIDCNPTKVCAELSFFIKTHPKPNIIVLGSKNCKFINENKLNETLKLYCNTFPNCTFLNTCGFSDNKKDFIRNVIFKINILIDSLYYERNYLNYNKIKIMLANQKLAQNSNTANNFHEQHPNKSKLVKKTLTQKKITNFFTFNKSTELTDTGNYLFR